MNVLTVNKIVFHLGIKFCVLFWYNLFYNLSYNYIHYCILLFSAVENGVFTPKPVQHVF